MGILSYFLGAGAVVKTVMLILLLGSLLSWTLIFQRFSFFREKSRDCERFENLFWKSEDLSELYRTLERNRETEEGLSAMFYHGFREYMRLNKSGRLHFDPLTRVMQISHAKEAQKMEENLSIFAQIGSISPYIGLFGTVWGIMTSFQSLGQTTGQATLAMVAPGISEALVATALGLFTAIPAVIAYNRFSTRANELLAKYDLFQEEFLALIEEQSTIARS